MFCMSCGTEAIAGASKCARCGAPLPQGGITEATTASASGPAGRAPDTSLAESTFPSLAVPSHNSVHRLSRNAVILIVLALGTDMLAPWLRLPGGETTTASDAGFPVILTLCVLAGAALSTVVPSKRKHPAMAMIPLAAGGFSMGAVVTLATRLTVLALPAFSTPSSVTPQPVQLAPEMGLYLFLIGSLLLLVAGYGVLIADA